MAFKVDRDDSDRHTQPAVPYGATQGAIEIEQSDHFLL